MRERYLLTFALIFFLSWTIWGSRMLLSFSKRNQILLRVYIQADLREFQLDEMFVWEVFYINIISIPTFISSSFCCFHHKKIQFLVDIFCLVLSGVQLLLHTKKHKESDVRIILLTDVPLFLSDLHIYYRNWTYHMNFSDDQQEGRSPGEGLNANVLF